MIDTLGGRVVFIGYLEIAARGDDARQEGGATPSRFAKRGMLKLEEAKTMTDIQLAAILFIRTVQSHITRPMLTVLTIYWPDSDTMTRDFSEAAKWVCMRRISMSESESFGGRPTLGVVPPVPAGRIALTAAIRRTIGPQGA